MATVLWFLHEFQTLIASLIAILAAVIVYHNVSRQLQSAAREADRARVEQRRAIAGR